MTTQVDGVTEIFVGIQPGMCDAQQLTDLASELYASARTAGV